MKKLIVLSALILLASCSTPTVETTVSATDSTAVECVDTCATTTITAVDTAKVDTVKVK